MDKLLYYVRGWLTGLLILALPPAGIAVKRGFGGTFWICLLLTIIGYVPGLFYAVYRMIRPGRSSYEVHVGTTD